MATQLDPLLHIVVPATCEVSANAGRGQKYDGVGISLDPASGLCVAVGREKRVAAFPAASVQRVHAKFIGSGKLTFEVSVGKQGVKQLLVSRAQPDDLKALLGTLDEAAKRARQRGIATISQEDAIALLQMRYPDQVKRQLAKLREAKGSDAPQPLKGHTRLMLVVDAAGQSVNLSAVGARSDPGRGAALAERELASRSMDRWWKWARRCAASPRASSS